MNELCTHITLLRGRWGWAAKSNIKSAPGTREEKRDELYRKEVGEEVGRTVYQVEGKTRVLNGATGECGKQKAPDIL